MNNADNLIYHYCSLSVFKSIIENKSLWLTDITKSNDSLELEWIANQYIDFLNDECSGFEADAQTDKHEKIKGELKAVQKLKNIILFAVPIYVLCFSEKGDDLSQWRGYGDDGYGVAIGVDKSYFSTLGETTIPGEFPYLTKIKYESSEQLKITFRNLIDSIESGMGYSDELISVRKEVLNAAPHYKSNSFVDEAEWRICLWSPKGNDISFQQQDFDKGQRKFYTRKDNLISYFEVHFTNMLKALKHIYIGPKSKVEVYDIKRFLAASGIAINDTEFKIEVEKSKLSYR